MSQGNLAVITRLLWTIPRSIWVRCIFLLNPAGPEVERRTRWNWCLVGKTLSRFKVLEKLDTDCVQAKLWMSGFVPFNQWAQHGAKNQQARRNWCGSNHNTKRLKSLNVHSPTIICAISNLKSISLHVLAKGPAVHRYWQEFWLLQFLATALQLINIPIAPQILTS